MVIRILSAERMVKELGWLATGEEPIRSVIAECAEHFARRRRGSGRPVGHLLEFKSEPQEMPIRGKARVRDIQFLAELLKVGRVFLLNSPLKKVQVKGNARLSLAGIERFVGHGHLFCWYWSGRGGAKEPTPSPAAAVSKRIRTWPWLPPQPRRVADRAG